MKVRVVFFLLIFAAILLPWGSHPTRAQSLPDGLQIQLETGLDGLCRVHEWMPVRVRVSNNGADLPNARLEIRVPTYGDSKRPVYTITSDLPGGGRKAFTIYVYAPPNTDGNIYLFLKVNNKTLGSVQTRVHCLPEDEILLGVWGDRAPEEMFSTALYSNMPRPSIAFLSAENLPDQPFGLDALSALVIGPQSDTRTLRPEQVQAIQLWVLGGGNLLVIGGGNWTNALGLQALLPMQPQGSVMVNGLTWPQTTFDTPLTASSGPAASDAYSALYSTDNQPLFFQHRYGAGEVAYLALNPDLLPDASAKQQLFSTIPWNVLPGSQHWIGFRSTDGPYDPLYNALHNLSQQQKFPIWLVCSFLGVYLLLLGPVSFRLLRRHRERIWGSSLVLALGFTLFMITAGTRLHGRLVFNQLSVVQAWEQSDTAVVRGASGLYSPRRTRLSPHTDRQVWMSVMQPDSFSPMADIEFAPGGVRLPDTLLNVSTMVHFTTAYTSPAPDYQSALEIGWKEGSLLVNGTLTWNEDFPLHNAVLITNNGSYALGEIRPGENIFSIRALKNDIHLSSTDYNNYNVYNGFPSWPNNANGAPQIFTSIMQTDHYASYQDDFWQAQRQDILLSAVRKIPYQPSEQVWIAGWAQGNNKRFTPQWSLSNLPLQLDGEQLYLLSTNIILGAAPSSGKAYTQIHEITVPDQLSYIYPNDEDTFNGMLPNGLYGWQGQYTLNEAALDIVTKPTGQAVTVALWNRETETFDVLPPPVNDHIEIPKAWQYFSPEGMFTIRYTNPDSNDVLRIKKMRLTVIYVMGGP